MKIDVLCSIRDHPINPWLIAWANERTVQHEVRLLHRKDQLASGDVLFLISCTEVIPADLRDLYGSCVVLHASDLPKGRVWSPHIWSILEGAARIAVSAINAEDRIDSGAVWAKKSFNVAPHELYDEISKALFDTEIALMDQVIGMVESDEPPHPQPDEEATYYPRRMSENSELDLDLSIAEQFDQIRVCDPDRYPAFFRMHGNVYSVSLKKEQCNE
jgi:methionyl-tRNA formyltransferase